MRLLLAGFSSVSVHRLGSSEGGQIPMLLALSGLGS